MSEEVNKEQQAIDNLEKARKAAETRNQSRVDRLNAIADNNDKAKAGEMSDTDGDLVLTGADDNKLIAEEAQKAADEIAKAEAAAKALQEEGAAQETIGEEVEPTQAAEKTEETSNEVDDERSKKIDGVTHYLTVVNGKEKWLTLEQLIATSQKIESADEYLANAKKNETKTEPVKEVEVKVERPDWKKTLHDAVMGDEEAISKVASALESRPSEVTPDVVRQIDDRSRFLRAAEWFEETYGDLLADARLKKLVYEEDAELAKANPQMPYKQRLKTAGDAIRTAVSGWTKQPEKVVVKTSTAKQEAKRTLPVVPQAAMRQAMKADEEDEETVEQSIAKMAQARGTRAHVHRKTN